MPFDNLTDREQQILRVLIDHYIATAEPVGSRVLANRYPLNLSPATIRNTMQDLEEMGLIKQPHTSAGRVPTDEGYRVYVDSLISPQPISESVASRLREQLMNRQKRTVEDILGQTAHVLAQLTSQIGVTLAPSVDRGVISRIELVPVSERRLLVVLGIHSGIVRTVLLEVSADVDRKTIEETQMALNDRLAGQTLGTLKTTGQERLRDDQRADARLLKVFFDAADDLVQRPLGETLHVDGTANLLSQPEFSNHTALRGVVQAIEERLPIIQMLQSRGVGEGLVVSIGREVKIQGAEGCSMVSANYRVGRIEGTVGIMGPTRMEYAKVVSIVDYVAKLLSEQMEG
ncbi:MAG: heat-inducible transcriptional repressor HrcA [Candidatus Zixiibacteriota bacterium]